MAVNRIISNDERVDVHWRSQLPVLRSAHVTAREMRRSDAAPLHAIASHREVARFMWPAPPNVAAVERFIDWARRERRAGAYICFGLVSAATDRLAGLIELRRLQPDFFRAEAGFFVDPDYWGSGIFADAADMVFEFAFDVVAVSRIEARTSVENLRGNGALAKAGFRHEGLLRDAFVHDGRYSDQNLWALSRRQPSVLLSQRSV
jgi:ribosomal-protein-alanine N-acetyltransferase